MKRLFGFIFGLALLAGCAVWLADQSGSARIVWRGYIIETSASFLMIAACVFAVAFYGILRLWTLLRHGSEMWRLGRRVRILNEGHGHVMAGLVALAGADAAEAGRCAVAARRKLGATAMTKMLQAQAAQLAGDHGVAQEIFRDLAADPDSAILGYRGLIMEARRRDDSVEIERLANELRRIKGDVPLLGLVRFDLAVRQQKWGEAGAVLSSPGLAQQIGQDHARRARAAILIMAAEQATRQGDHNKALQATGQALKQTPDWLPAILAFARAQMKTGHRRAAHRLIEKVWTQQNYPELAAIYVDDISDVLERYRRVEQLCRIAPDAAQSRRAVAEAALAADLWGEARRHLQTLVNRGQATVGVYRMLAQLERREHKDEQAATAWLTQALDATADPAWLCRSCGGAHAAWQATCKHCGGFITLEWQSPGVSLALTKQAGGASSLPALDWMD